MSFNHAVGHELYSCCTLSEELNVGDPAPFCRSRVDVSPQTAQVEIMRIKGCKSLKDCLLYIVRNYVRRNNSHGIDDLRYRITFR